MTARGARHSALPSITSNGYNLLVLRYITAHVNQHPLQIVYTMENGGTAENGVKEETVQPAIKDYGSRSDSPTGVRAGLESLFRDHHDMVYRTAYRVTGSPVDAEDVLQTLFLRLASHPVTPDLSPSPGAYLRRAAINASLDLVKSHARTRSVPLDGLMSGEPVEDHQHSPEASQATRELRTCVRQSVAALGAKAAEIVALRYFEDMNNREIADIIGTSQMVIAVTLHRARTRLRKDMGKLWEAYHEAH
ncbi:MAG TPA: sigma-70 family RNA polymerase sigma factor [Blastocatellia bacterium]|nr:sigma-70 family RNA polymerase sigma factor [Blastocatellia bacterium]